MKNAHRSARLSILALIVMALVGCTPGGGGTSAPAAPGGVPASAAPASAAPVVPGY